MKILFFILPLIILIAIVVTKLVVTDQENAIKILDQEIYILEGEIEKIETDMTYTTNPQNLKKMNEEEFKLTPIEEEDLLKMEKLK